MIVDDPQSRLRVCCQSDFEREPHELGCPNRNLATKCDSCGRYVELQTVMDPSNCPKCGAPIELLAADS